MGLSVAKDELYYIYVLRVEGNGWYVGSTQSFERRMRSHFGKGGAVATKERRALAILISPDLQLQHLRAYR
ncbi:GIY-YIG nuclease family protein [Xanthomonas axonopodis pv. phyllanthi]|uniref:GIY-YIG nuclease family protein n=1 Tax=Xanthomonas axonopodis TaxID=53413 RepID=UPI003556BC3F